MVPFVQVSPSITTEPAGSFRAHSNYLRAFARLAGFVLPTTAYLGKAHIAVAERALSSPTLKALSPRAADIEQIAASLGNAWGTELLLGLSGKYAVEDALVRLTNNWGVVQLYYVFYHAAQALFVARTGQVRPGTHSATQNDFVDYWTAREVDLAPWSLAADADGYRNWPDDLPPDPKVHPWGACTEKTAWDLAALALRTTRRDAIDEALKRRRVEKQRLARRAWQEDEKSRLASGKRPRKEPKFPRPNLNSDERARVAARVRAHGLIDYVYRLRVKTNYDDSMMFTEGPQNEADSVVVHSDLINLASTTLLVHEMHIRRVVGIDDFCRMIDRWIEANHAAGAQLGIAGRREIVLST